MAENKYNLYELQKKIPYGTVAPILTEWVEHSDSDVTDLARMAYEAGRNSISKEKNKMEQVAALFGKKLGEEFEIRYKDENYIAYFRKEGLKVRGLFCLTWDNALVALLTGRAVIVDE